MAQVSVGKLLPNLKVTLGNDTTEIDSTEEKSCESSEKSGKISSDNPNVEIVRSWMESLQNPKVYKNKSGGFSTGLDLISEENTELLGKRAERFGLEKEESSLAPNISSLYESMGITIDNKNSAKMKNIRLDALHMRGVNELSTNEIFDYFRDYGPASVEWINDFSCNVVWLDETSCARALLGVSKPLSNSKASAVEEETQSNDSNEASESMQNHEPPTEEQNESKVETEMDVDDDSQMKSESSESSTPLNIPVPPGCWRLGTAHPKAKSILLRFATKDDKKLPGAEKRSDYYKKYGNPNYGGLRGLISSSRKRKMQAATNRRAIEVGSSRSISLKSLSSDALHSDDPVQKAPNPKPPRMRMYADDEEIKTRKLRFHPFRMNDPFRSRDKAASVHSRLGAKYTNEDLCHLGSYNRTSTFDEGVPRRERKRNWSSSDDLRTKLRRIRDDNATKHRSPLCIDSDNSSDD